MRHFDGVEWKYRIVKVVWISLIVAFAYYISRNWYQISLIRGDSMSPSYHNMQFVMLDRHTRDYSYGDVITFQCENLNTVLVKRIVACPEDQVVIKNGILYVNDAVSVVFPEKYIFTYAGVAKEHVNLEENQYFVIGDNLEKSKDSRYAEVGIVYGDDILGRILPWKSVCSL